MARDFNQFRNANAKLGKKTIDKLGTTYAVQYGLDGFSAVNNVVAPMPTDIKEYLEGNDDITIYACSGNIDKLCEYALTSFPNIEDLYLFKTSAIVVLEDDLSYLLGLNKIYVPSDLLSAYISAYPTLSSKFDIIVEDYTLTIPFIGDTTLTSEYVDSVIAMLSSAEKNAITKVIIPTDFSESSANAIAWYYDFSAIVNLNNNIWYGATKIDFSVWTIEGSGSLTSSNVESSIDSIPNDKVSSITKLLVPNTFIYKNLGTCYETAKTLLPNLAEINGIDLSLYTPKDYVSIEHNTGKTCLVTSYSLADLDLFEVKAKVFESATAYDTYGGIFYGGSSPNACYLDVQQSRYHTGWLNTQNYPTTAISDKFGKNIYSVTYNGQFKVNENVIQNYNTQFTGSGTLTVGRNHDKVSPTANFYEIVATKNNVILQDLVPVLIISNNTYRMLDLISSNLFDFVGLTTTGGND